METLPNYEEESKKYQHQLIRDEGVLSLAWEYARLAIQRPLSENSADRLEEILVQAQEDGVLEFWINEIDHFIDHELKLTTHTKTYSINAQEMKEELLKHLNLDTEGYGLINILNEDADITIDVIPSKIQEVQSRLKRCGLYGGPIDGVVGYRTKEALVTFQKQHNIAPSGLIDGTTLIACEAI